MFTTLSTASAYCEFLDGLDWKEARRGESLREGGGRGGDRDRDRDRDRGRLQISAEGW